MANHQQNEQDRKDGGLEANEAQPSKIAQLAWLSPILIAVFLIPLLRQVRLTTLSPIERILFNVSTETHYDVYTKIKAEWLLMVTGLALVFLLAKILKEGIKKKLRFAMIPAALYTLTVMASALSARYRDVFNKNFIGVINNPEKISEITNLSVQGFMEHYEGLQTLMCYVVLFAVTYIMVETPFQKKAVINAMLLSAVTMAMMAIPEYFGAYFHETALGLRLLLGSHGPLVEESLRYNLIQYYAVGTLYNPNYLGGYSAVMLMLAVGQLFGARGKEARWGYLVASVLIFTMLLTSNSNTGMIAVAVSGVLFTALSFRRMAQKWSWTVMLMGGFILSVVLLNTLSDKRLGGELHSMEDELQMVAGNYVNPKMQVLSAQYLPDGLTLHLKETALTIVTAEEALYFLDEAMRPIPSEVTGDVIQLTKAPYEKVKATYIAGGAGINLSLDGVTLTLRFEEDGAIAALGSGAIPYPLTYEVETMGFKGSERFASNRGYIWSRSLPLLKDTLILGTGPDTYPAVFPQYDILGKANHMNRSTLLVDKPHNLYMQVWIQTGLLSLLALITLVVAFMIKMLKSDYGKPEGLKSLEVGMMTAMVAFALQGLANDSTLPLTMVVWVLMGVGFAEMTSASCAVAMATD